jgi:hypothetical protein
MRVLVWVTLSLVFLAVPTFPATPVAAFDGRTLTLMVENQTFGQVMNVFHQQTGLEYDVPGDLQQLRLPLVEIKNLNLRDALLRVLEGSNYDYILVAAPGEPDRVVKLLVTGKSTKVTAVAGAFRGSNRPMEDPFGGGAEPNVEDNSNVQPPPEPPNPAGPGQNPPPQGAAPVQPGVQPVPANPNQAPQPGVVFPQQQGQPQGLQPFNPFGNQNNRRSPY